MNQTTKPAVPLWYWAIAVVSLVWNLMGCATFAVDLFAQETAIASMTEVQQEWARSIPGWIYVVFGVAVTTGVAGTVGLFMRKGWTVALFAICLAAVTVQMIYTMIISGGLQAMGPSGAVMPSLVIGFAAASLWYSWCVRRWGWLS